MNFPSILPGAGYQFMLLSFTDKLAIQISQSGQAIIWNEKTVYRSFTPGQITIENIYSLFLEAGIPMPVTFEMVFLGLDQHLHELESSSLGKPCPADEGGFYSNY